MKYLVTGGCGFIGSHLCDALIKDGHSIIVIDDLSSGRLDNIKHLTDNYGSDRVNIQIASICEKDVFDNIFNTHNDIAGCFHLAAIASVERSVKEWEHTHKVNVGGMVNLLSAISRKINDCQADIPVVYASSAAVYGDNSSIPLSENSDISPLTAYGSDKYSCELHAKVGFLTHGIRSVGLRFFNVYGSRQDASSPYSGVISIFADKINRGKDITFYGDGNQTRDFIHVSDIVKTLRKAMEKLEEKSIECDVINVCRGKETSLKELANTLETITGKKVQKHHREARKGDIYRSCGNADKLRGRLGIVASKELKEGLKELIKGNE